MHKKKRKILQSILNTYSRANERVTGERTGVQGSSHSGSGLISSGAGFTEEKHTPVSHSLKQALGTWKF